MSDTVLIYLSDPTPDLPALQRTISQAQQSSGGHLFVVAADTLGPPKGARVIRSPDDLQAIGEALSKSDSLFASAWFARSKTKDRPGDGEAWDKPGFDCP